MRPALNRFILNPMPVIKMTGVLMRIFSFSLVSGWRWHFMCRVIHLLSKAYLLMRKLHCKSGVISLQAALHSNNHF